MGRFIIRSRTYRYLLASVLPLGAAAWAALGSSSATAQPGEAGAVLFAVGDIGDCARGNATAATSNLLVGTSGPIALLGDIAYPDGLKEDFDACFDPAWAKHKDRLRPVPGNHEYHIDDEDPNAPRLFDDQAKAYFDYFGAAAGDPTKGYYSYDVGDWHVVALNSNCDQIDCAAELDWLRADLTAQSKACTLAYFHHPRFSSGAHGDNDGPPTATDPTKQDVRPFWNALAAANADLVLAGHDHNYERFNPIDGMTSFVVGTGGTSLRRTPPTADPNTAVYNRDTHGVLKLNLLSSSFSWEFIPVAGATFRDTGTAQCH